MPRATQVRRATRVANSNQVQRDNSPSSLPSSLLHSHSHLPMRTSHVRGFESAAGAYSCRRSRMNARVGWLYIPVLVVEPETEPGRRPGGVGPPCGATLGVCGRTGVRIGPCPCDLRRCDAPALRLLIPFPLFTPPADPYPDPAPAPGAGGAPPVVSGGGEEDEGRSEGRDMASSACACKAALTGACPTCGMRDMA